MKSLEISTKKEMNSISVIEDYAKEALNNLIDYRLTDHSVNHSFRILTIIDRILEQTRIKNPLSDIERYILRAAALLHDIGMQEEISAPDSYFRRENHSTLSVNRIQSDFEKIGIVRDLVDFVCDVILAHRGTFSKKSDLVIRTGQKVRLDLLEALLFIGDELDITQERVNVDNLKKLNYDIDNHIHFFKHLYTAGVDISNNRGITILFQHPKGREKTYQPILHKYVIIKIEESLKNANNILAVKYGIDIYLDKSRGISYKESASIPPIPPDIFEKIQNKMFLPKSIIALNAMNFKEMKGNHDAEQFFSGYTRWEEIVNDLDIQRTQSNNVYKTLLKNMQACIKERGINYYLITGGGGSGKTTFMMRLAYKLFNNENKNGNVLWYDGTEYFESLKLPNIYRANQKPIYIFIDTPNINAFVENVARVKDKLEDSNVPILLIIAARLSEWENAITKVNFLECNHEKVQLNNLDDKEIIHLLNKLDIYNELGALNELSDEERVARLKEKHERQLLVAMLEATRGDNFENIIIDEYEKLKISNPNAAKAYLLITLFHKFFVSTPQSILLRFLACDDEEELQENILKYTRLIIVKDVGQRFGDFYKSRHRKIAEVLMKKIVDYDTEAKRLKRVGAVINQIDVYIRHERYYIIQFCSNYIENIIRAYPKAEFEDRIYELRNKILDKKSKFIQMVDVALKGCYVPELSLLNSIFFRTSLSDLQIYTLEKWLEIEPNNLKTNEFLAKAMKRSKKGSPREVAKYYYQSYTCGNRKVIFLLEFIQYCVKYRFFDYIEKVIDGIKDFATYSEEENEALKKLEILLNGYKVNRDRDKLAEGATVLFGHLQASKLLKPEAELFYIASHEATNPKEAYAGYELHLETIAPSRPKSILLRLAYVSSLISDKKGEAQKYYEELFNTYLKDIKNKENYIIAKNYFQFALRAKLYDKEKYYMIFNHAKKLNKNDIHLYLLFAQYLLSLGELVNLKNCKNVTEEGIALARELNKMYGWETVKLKEILNQLINTDV